MRTSNVTRVLGLGWSVLMVSGTSAGAQTVRTTTQTIPGTDISFTLSRIPEGAFTIGSPESEIGREPDEGPQRVVSLEAYWITVYEVTHSQFAIFRYRQLDSGIAAAEAAFDVDAVTRPTPPYEDPAHSMGQGDHPATGMTQWAALQYARWLSLKTGRLFRLPTEAEWEYACRADTNEPYPRTDPAHLLNDVAWYASNSGSVFHPVGQKLPNAWGLHDMSGNAAEWTLDQYEGRAYESWIGDAAHMPWRRPTREHPRTVRGGAFNDESAHVRCAYREASTLQWKRRDPQLPQSRWWNTDSPHVGFRLVTPDRPYRMAEIEAYWEELLGSN